MVRQGLNEVHTVPRRLRTGARAGTAESSTKGRRTETKLGRQDSNLGMAGSKPAALPLGDAPLLGHQDNKLRILSRLVNRNPRMKMRQIAALPFVKSSQLGAERHQLARVSSDSRRAGPDVAFFALQGRQTDGHRFAESALAAGAPAVFVSDGGAYDALCILQRAGRFGEQSLFWVAPGRAPLADLVRAIYEAPSERLSLYGVTGTNGKATVTFLVAQMLGTREIPCGILGGLGHYLPRRVLPAERTTPEAPDIAEFLRLCREEGVPNVTMEVSSIGIQEERTRGLHFRGAAYTNLTQDHLDYHGTMEAYRLEKERMFLEYPLDSAVLNVDDRAIAALVPRLRAERPEVPVLTYALNGAADLIVSDLQLTHTGTIGQVHFRGRNAAFNLPLPGAFNISNWLTAAGLLLHQGWTVAEVAHASSACTGAPGRLEQVPLNRPFGVLVDYAHTPDALDTVLRTLRPLTPGRLIVLFGCGGDRDRDKRPKMGAIAEQRADLVVLTTDNPRSESPAAILAEVRRGMHGSPPPLIIENRAEAIHAALDLAKPGDLVLLAGKGAETYQVVQGNKLPFDDR